MFDTDKFWATVDSTCVARGLTHKQAAAQARISASTMTRLSQGRNPDVDTFAALVLWMGVSADLFLRQEPVTDLDDRINATVWGMSELTDPGKQYMEELIHMSRRHFGSDIMAATVFCVGSHS